MSAGVTPGPTGYIVACGILAWRYLISYYAPVFQCGSSLLHWHRMVALGAVRLPALLVQVELDYSVNDLAAMAATACPRPY